MYLHLLTLLLVLAAGSAVGADPAAPALVVDGVVHDFGVVDRGTSVEHPFRLRNDGSAPLLIEQVKSPCGCTAVLGDREVAPGAEGYVTVRLDTTRLVGRATRSVTLHTNDPERPVVPLTVSGEVTSDVLVTPTPLYLGKLARSDTVERELRIVSGRAGTSVEVTWVEAGPRLRTRLEPLPDASGQRLVVMLDAGMPLGRFHDELRLHTTSLREPVVIVPVFGSIERDLVGLR